MPTTRPHPFGELVSAFRARKHGLTQARLAELAGYDAAVIARMCQGGRGLSGTNARERILRVIQALDESGVLNGVEEANALLAAASLPPLFKSNDAEDALIRRLVMHHHATTDGSTVVPSAPRHNLPAPLTSFVGRESEISEITHFLTRPLPAGPRARTQPQARLVTLTGPGGVGKTRLALEAASQMTGFPDGAWWVPLAGVTDTSLVAQTIVSTLELNRRTNASPQGVLADYLGKRRLLLLLDNCEHLVDACAELVAHLMSACPGLRILATSREALQVPGELALRVPPLPVPYPALANRHNAMDFDAVRLFVERAQAMRPDFALAASNVSAVAHICERLDGIPLALELAAALLQAMSVDEIAARIDNRFVLLKGGYRAITLRHQALSNAVDWSYELLTPPEQALLARLSIFASGWDAEAAEAVCANDGDVQRDDILPLLCQLVNKSLVVTDETSSGATRYRLLKTIREYAADKLRERKEDTMIKDKHLAYLVALAEAADAQLTTRDHNAAMSRLIEQQDELRAALAHAEQSGDGEGLLRLATALQWFWRFQERRDEGTAWRDKALALGKDAPARLRLALMFAWGAFFYPGEVAQLASILSDVDACLDACRAAQDQIGVAQALTLQASYEAAAHKRYDEVVATLREALRTFEAQGDSRAINSVRQRIGEILEMQDDTAQAEAWLRENEAIFRNSGSFWHLSLALEGQALLAGRKAGGHKRAIELWHKSLEAAQKSGEKGSIGDITLSLGYAELDVGDHAQAAEHFVQALQMVCDTDNKPGIRWAQLAACSADTPRTLAIIKAYLHTKQQANDKQGIAAGHYFLGMTYQDGDAHDYVQARQLLEQSLAMWRESGIVTTLYGGTALILADLGRTYYFLGDHRRAIRCFEEAIQLRQEAKDDDGMDNLHMYRGYAKVSLGDLDSAEADFRTAIRTAQHYKQSHLYVPMAGLGEVAWQRGQAELAGKWLGSAAADEDHVRKYGTHTWSADYVRLMDAAREWMSNPAFAAGWEAGQKLTYDEAKALLDETMLEPTYRSA